MGITLLVVVALLVDELPATFSPAAGPLLKLPRRTHRQLRTNTPAPINISCCRTARANSPSVDAPFPVSVSGSIGERGGGVLIVAITSERPSAAAAAA
jgi:hypothetical protein